MGRTLIEAVQADRDLLLVGALEAPGHPALGRDAGDFLGVATGVPIRDDAGAAIRSGSCVIDFTRPAATLQHLSVARRQRASMVIGTTGFTEREKQLIRDGAADIPIVMAPNMAVGVNAVFKLAEVAARILGDSFDVEIIEAHHRHKVDAPSGTALKLGEIIAGVAGRDLAGAARHGRSGNTGERERGAIGFHAVRGGDIVGEHTVIFAGAGERVEIAVRSSSRATYAFGALRAARFLSGRTDGLFDMQDVLGLR